MIYAEKINKQEVADAIMLTFISLKFNIKDVGCGVWAQVKFSATLIH